MQQIERERVFLLNKAPYDLKQYEPIEIQVGDFFDSNAADALKIRKKGEKYHLIKKITNSSQERVEHVIDIKPGEFARLIKATVQSHRKMRYLYKLNKYLCEIDFYQDSLEGYARVEVEFENQEEMDNFIAPDWFGPEITEINHDIHEDLGLVNFAEMEERYRNRGIKLNPINLRQN